MKAYNKPVISVIKVDDNDIIQTSSLGNDGSGSDEGELEWGTPVASPAKIATKY